MGNVVTAAGAGAAILVSYGLVTAFTSALVAADVLARPAFPVAVAAAASAWVLFASATGLPVSTTHDGRLVAAPVRRVVASVEGCDATPDRVRLLAGQLTHWGRRPR